MIKAIVILSGGLDSSVNFAWALREFEVVKGVTFDYGQRAAGQEIEHSRLLSKHYGKTHEIISIPFLAEWTATSLVRKDLPLPLISFDSLDRKQETRVSARAVWVPNRNGIFLNIAAALAESLEAERLVVGFNREEGETFPDNSREFVNGVNKALFYSTANHVEVACGTLNMNKSEIVKLGIELRLPFELVWSCYEGGEKMCGVCESCLRLKRGVRETDPRLLEVLSFAN